MIAENMIRLLLMEYYWRNYKNGDKSVIKTSEDKDNFISKLRSLRADFLDFN